MKMEIISRNKNPLLFREDVTFLIKESKTTPSKKELRQKIAASLNKKEGAIFIKKIEHHFGSSEIRGLARAYDSAEKATEIEYEYIINRNLGIKKKKAEEEEKVEEAKPAKEKADEEKIGEKGGKAEERPAEKKGEDKEKREKVLKGKSR